MDAPLERSRPDDDRFLTIGKIDTIDRIDEIEASDPIARFRSWYRDAEKRGARQPDAMALATVGRGGVPSLRFVLLKGADERGFVFVTDGRSRKGGELARNAHVAATFYWNATGKQVRIEGRARPVSAAESDELWRDRPRGSQLSAAASLQSALLAERAVLVRRRAELARRFRGQPVPRPDGWCGYRIVPERIELWVHRANRLHHRELFERSARGWRKTLLQP